MIGRCKECGYWEDADICAGQYLDMGRCKKKVEQFWDNTQWTKGGEREFKDPNVLALTQDGSDYISMLLTKPAFGCVMFHAKKNELESRPRE